MRGFVSVTLLAGLAAAAIEVKKTSDLQGDMHSWDFFGDCIGLSPVIFGKEGQFVQSDM